MGPDDKMPADPATDDDIARRMAAFEALEEISKGFPTETPLDSMTYGELLEEAYGDRG